MERGAGVAVRNRYGINTPAMHPVIQQVSAPASIARGPIRAKSERRSGAIAVSPPIWIAIEGKFAKPQSA